MPAPQPSWTFAPGAVHIRYRADARLNEYNGGAHTVVMAVYQTTVPDPFADMTKTEDGLRALLEVKRFDPSVVALDRVIVQPGETNTVTVDRAESARWVCIVIGYYNLVPGQVSRTFEVPFTVEQRGTFRKRKIARVSMLDIELILGPRSLATVGNN
jgi:predicted component of type VI protein secretion system